MIIAVDTGGTKTLVARFSADGTIEASEKFPTPIDTDKYLEQLTTTIRAVSGDKTPQVIAIAMPGWIQDDIIISCGNLPWRNFPIKAELAKHFKGTAILVENDANLGGLGEVHTLKKIPHRCLYVTVSTGIGGGFIVDGAIDPATRTGEIGSMRLEFDGKVVQWEQIASGKALAKEYHSLASDLTDHRHWRAVANRLSRGFLAFLPILRPDMVIIGGGVGAHFDNFATYLSDDIGKYLPKEYQCPIVQAQHPEEAVIHGCYRYAIDRHG